MRQQVCRPPCTLQHDLVAHYSKVEFIGPGFSVRGGWGRRLFWILGNKFVQNVVCCSCCLSSLVRFAEFMHKCYSHTCCLDEWCTCNGAGAVGKMSLPGLCRWQWGGRCSTNGKLMIPCEQKFGRKLFVTCSTAAFITWPGCIYANFNFL
jgi:hypothetical protein